jgi:hypothetical protein
MYIYFDLNFFFEYVYTNFWVPGQKETWPPPPILQIMILKLSPPRYIISKKSAQQKWIDELWFRKQLSTLAALHLAAICCLSNEQSVLLRCRNKDWFPWSLDNVSEWSKLSPPRYIISKKSAQQKWIDELWFRKQLSTCLFVWTLNYNSVGLARCIYIFKEEIKVKVLLRCRNKDWFPWSLDNVSEWSKFLIIL